MDRFEKDILKFIRDNELLEPGAFVAAGLSGGADSVCLLHVLNSLQRVLKLKLLAVHVNHGIRGPEADRDEAFCRELAAGWGIGFRAAHVDVPALAKSQGLSLEEAARIARYEALQKEAAAWREECREGTGTQDRQEEGTAEGSVRIAVAHHADDQAETVLLNLSRGSGLKGLCGMQARRDNIIRPLLLKSRKDILQYIEDHGLEYVTDSTNLEPDQTRNRVRQVILPALAGQVNERAAEHICRSAEMIREADDFLTECAVSYLDGITQEENEPPAKAERAEGGTPAAVSVRLGQKELKEKPQILRRYVIIEALRRLGVPLKDWGEIHIREIDGALYGRRGYHVDLPGGVYAENEYRETFLRREDPGGVSVISDRQESLRPADRHKGGNDGIQD